MPFESEPLTGVAVVVDISGFTSLEISLNTKGREGIEEFGETLHAIFDVLVHLAVENGGLVLEFAGDALICFFCDGDFQTGDDFASPETEGQNTLQKARSACEQMIASIRPFMPAIRLHGGVARGELRALHLGCSTRSMNGDSRRGNLFVGSALEAAVKLLDESVKGEILVEGEEAVREDNLPSHLNSDANVNWWKEMRDERRAEDAAFAPRDRVLNNARRPSFEAKKRRSVQLEVVRNTKVQDTWKMVEANLEDNGVAFFKAIFEIAPGALQLFSFRDVENVYESPELRAHAKRVMTTVGVAVAGLRDIGKLVPVLEMLGKKHLTYGVLPAHYDVVGQALLQTLEAGLGAHWTPDVHKAWSDVYGTVAGVMKSAAEDLKQKEDERKASVSLLGAKVQEAMATTGVHYLQRYVLRHVVVNERNTGHRMSELRNISSLFANVSVPLDARGEIDLDAHNRAFAACHECVESLGGVVNQYLWDDKGVVMKAAWGLLRPTRDDKKHAALCALQLVEALGSQIRVGVASGMAFTGLVGAEGMRLGMVMFGAESVTLAARLMMKANHGSALVSAHVMEATRKHIAYEGEDEPPLKLKGRDADEPVCRPTRVVEDALDLLDKGSDLKENILPRPSVQGPLREAINAFVQRDSHDVAASVVVMQGIGGCGKTTLVEALATTVVEERLAGTMPSDRAPDVCTITAALQHETSPYFVWRWFLCWALSESRDDEPATAGRGKAGGQSSSKAFSNKSLRMLMSRKMSTAQGRSLRANRSGVGGGGSGGSGTGSGGGSGNLSGRMASIRGLGGSDSGRALAHIAAGGSSGSLAALVDNDFRHDRVKQVGGWNTSNGADVMNLDPNFKVHEVIIHRATAMTSPDVEPGEETAALRKKVKGASLVELAACELLFPSGNAYMETMLEGLADEDWIEAHALIKRIILHVVCRRVRPVIITVDDAHYCDPTSWHVLEWLVSRSAAAMRHKLQVVLAGLAPPEAPKYHVVRVAKLLRMGNSFAGGVRAGSRLVNVGAFTQEESRLVIRDALGVLEDESVSDDLLQYVRAQTQDSPRDIAMLVDLLCRESLVRVNAAKQHVLVVSNTAAKQAPTPQLRHEHSLRRDHIRGATSSGVELPDGIRAALVARIDMLTAAEADVLKCAAIVGVEFDTEVLLQTLEHSQPVLMGLLESIEAQGMIRTVKPGVFRFVHPLQAEVAASLMMTWQREEMHQLVASVYEFMKSELDPLTAERASHYARAGPEYAAEAARLHARAAEEADATGALALAGKHMREVIAIARAHDVVKSELPAYLAMASWNARALADDMARGLDEEDDDGSTAEEVESLRRDAREMAQEAMWILNGSSRGAWRRVRTMMTVKAKLKNAATAAAKGREGEGAYSFETGDEAVRTLLRGEMNGEKNPERSESIKRLANMVLAPA